MARPVAYYLTADWQVHMVPNVSRDGEGLEEALRQVREQVPAAGEFWFVYSRPFHGDPGGHFLAAARREFSLTPCDEFAGITLYRGRLGSR